MHVSACVTAIALYVSDFDTFSNNLNLYFRSQTNEKGFIGTQIFLAVSDFGMLLFILQLLIFHIYLITTDQTTYMYITSRKTRSKEYDV